jgi:hypothetical protein
MFAAMKTFHCDHCGSLVFFENVTCVACGHALRFLPDVLDLSAVEPRGDESWLALSERARERTYRSCQNAVEHQVCNWLVPTEDPSPFCVSCRLNDVIPDLSAPGNLERWHRLELAKRRLIYTLLKLGLPTAAPPSLETVSSIAVPDASGALQPAAQAPLRFRFMGDRPDGTPTLTGHAQGVITINIVEADDDVREQRRVSLHEPFRTLLGHFRHEIAHYYWDLLVASVPGRLQRFRTLFGDERADYAAALARHYRDGAPADWSARHVSAYASMHPWEDWAETTAHYLHITDTIETAAGFGLSLRPKHPAARTMTAEPRQAAQPDAGFDAVLNAWFPLTYALNSLNRGVGLPDLYPFVLSAPAIEKLRFVHDVLTHADAARPAVAA